MTRTNERPFDKALKEACKAYKELEKLQSESKLTADSFFKEALEAANIKESDLKPIAEALNSGKFPHCSAFVRSAEKWVREQTCKRPPRELRRLTWLGREADVSAECGRLKTDFFALFALATQTIIKKNPESFGGIEDWGSHHRKIEKVRQQLDELYSQIESSYDSSDLIIGEPDKKGNCKISFKATNGEVLLGLNAGERVVDWFSANQVKA
mgnify:CR=1 FL=1